MTFKMKLCLVMNIRSYLPGCVKVYVPQQHLPRPPSGTTLMKEYLYPSAPGVAFLQMIQIVLESVLYGLIDTSSVASINIYNS